jgi:tetratricopeptide (TPR) repeat protein
VANLELHERFFGSGLVGSIELEAALVQSFQRATGQIAGIRSELASLGWSIEQIPTVVSSLEHAVVVRLDQQTSYLASQLAALSSIDTALRTPAKVRAAERMSDAAGLLKSGRYERALACAEEAIEGDPNHPGGFAAAGSASIGLGRMREAAEHFLEAHAAGDEVTVNAGTHAKLAAKCLLIEGETERARTLLEEVVRNRAPHLQGESWNESDALLRYELAIACVLDGDSDSAADHLEQAIRLNTMYVPIALVEPVFSDQDDVLRRAVTVARAIAREQAEAERREAEAKRRVREVIKLKQRGARLRERLHHLATAISDDEWDSNGELQVRYDDAVAAVTRIPDVIRPMEPDLAVARAALANADIACAPFFDIADRIDAQRVAALDRAIAENRERVRGAGNRKPSTILRLLRGRR